MRMASKHFGIVSAGLHLSNKMSKQILPESVTLQWYTGVSKVTFGARIGYASGMMMLRTKTPFSKGESFGPSMRARQKFRLSSAGKTWMPSPECIQTSSAPLATFFNSPSNLLVDGEFLPLLLVPASSLTLSTLITFFFARSSAKPTTRCTCAPWVMLFSQMEPKSPRVGGRNAGLSAPPRRAFSDTTPSASSSSKPSPKSLICQHSPPVALTILRKLESGRFPTMMASTTAPMLPAASSACSGVTPALFCPSVSTRMRKSALLSLSKWPWSICAASMTDE
mmetsp:Transcript_49771/g.142914  ORF Transcript_49771/g.142914 Transcript_49771/m.142914 type:complete len:281 (+) Transcript_49771:452-1294(+)